MKDKPVFPVTIKEERPTNLTGYPNIVDVSYSGMTMRQYYKAAALQALMAEGFYSTAEKKGPSDGSGVPDAVKLTVKAAAFFADAMLAEDEEHEAKKP